MKAVVKKQLITKDMLVSEIVSKYPSTVPIMLAYGLHCFECGASELETLAEGTVGHGMTEEDLEMILKDVNEEAESAQAELATESHSFAMRSKEESEAKKEEK